MVVQLYEFDISKDYPKLQRTNKYDIFIPKQFFSEAFAPMKSKTDTIIYYNKSLRFLIK